MSTKDFYFSKSDQQIKKEGSSPLTGALREVPVISIGVAQIANSLEVEKNFQSIRGFLNRFKSEQVDLVVFPECSLSGFSAKMKECTANTLRPYLDQIQKWSADSGVQVILPTAFVDEQKIYNSGFLFKENSRQQFYKLGLTDSEKKFFSIPEIENQKVFELNGLKYALLICKEAQQDPWQYMPSEQIDFIIWPSYWGWTKECKWQAETDEKKNLVFENSLIWKAPVIQANFAFNDLGANTGAGPEGLSIVVNADNKLIFQASHLQECGFVIKLEKQSNRTDILSCRKLKTQ